MAILDFRAIFGLNSGVSQLLYDPIRQQAVPNTPEERVRQSLILQLIGPLAFPRGLISVEKTISHGRRADLIIYAKKQDQLVPLLLIECKAGVIDEDVVFRQAFGYNLSVAAPFWCVAHEGGVRLFWKDAGAIQSIHFIPTYDQLIQRLP